MAEIIGPETSIKANTECVGDCRIAPLVLTYYKLAMDAASTPTSRREVLVVDLRGMKAALFATARARGVLPSEFARATLTEAIDAAASFVATRGSASPSGETQVRLSLRMSRAQAAATVAAARAAGVAPGPYVAGLVAGIPALTSGRSRPEYLAALIASNTELTSLRRHLQQLNGLLRQGSMDASTECRETVDRLGQGVRGHLAAVSAVLADLRPRARGTAPTCRPPA